MLKPMLPTLAFETPQGDEWRYEIKFDGFRALLTWDQEIELTSRNGKPLLPLFPELSAFLAANKDKFQPHLPLTFDAELVYLENPYKANFGAIQIRGRMRAEGKIKAEADRNPCRLMVFDLLRIQGKNIASESYKDRRIKLQSLFSEIGLPLSPNQQNPDLVQLVHSEADLKGLWEKVVIYDGEGIIAKQYNSKWEEGKRTEAGLRQKTGSMSPAL